MMLKREGRFKSRIETAALSKTRANELWQVVILHMLTDELIDGEWEDIQSENATIRSYTVVQTKDGELNEAVLDRLQEAFPGWDKKTWEFWDLKDGPLFCQITVEHDTYYPNNKTAMKVMWINSVDDEGVHGMASAPEAVSELNALSGGEESDEPATAVEPTRGEDGFPAAPKPTEPITEKHKEPSPTMAKAKADVEEVFGKGSVQDDPAQTKPAPVKEAPVEPTPDPPPGQAPEDVWDKDRAWNSLVKFNPDVDREEMERRWHARVRQIGKEMSNFTSGDWKIMGAKDAVLPFGE